MALIAVAADKGAPGVTTTALSLAAVWPRPVLLAECDPAGGDLVYRLPAPGRGRPGRRRPGLPAPGRGRRPPRPAPRAAEPGRRGPPRPAAPADLGARAEGA